MKMDLPEASSQSGSLQTIETLQAIAKRYRDLEDCTKDSDSRQTFATIAEEYEQRADRVAAGYAR